MSKFQSKLQKELRELEKWAFSRVKYHLGAEKVLINKPKIGLIEGKYNTVIDDTLYLSLDDFTKASRYGSNFRYIQGFAAESTHYVHNKLSGIPLKGYIEDDIEHMRLSLWSEGVEHATTERVAHDYYKKFGYIDLFIDENETNQELNKELGIENNCFVYIVKKPTEAIKQKIINKTRKFEVFGSMIVEVDPDYAIYKISVPQNYLFNPDTFGKYLRFATQQDFDKNSIKRIATFNYIASYLGFVSVREMDKEKLKNLIRDKNAHRSSLLNQSLKSHLPALLEFSEKYKGDSVLNNTLNGLIKELNEN